MMPANGENAPAELPTGDIYTASMRPSLALELHRDAICLAVRRRRVSNPRIFGSVLHGTDTEEKESDLELLVDPQSGTTLFDLFGRWQIKINPK